MQLKTEQPTAGHLPWSDEGKTLLLAFEVLIKQYGGIDKLSTDIEIEDIKKEWRKVHIRGNSVIWTEFEDQQVTIAVSKRIFPIIKNRSACAVKNRLQIKGYNTKGLYHAL